LELNFSFGISKISHMMVACGSALDVHVTV